MNKVDLKSYVRVVDPSYILKEGDILTKDSNSKYIWLIVDGIRGELAANYLDCYNIYTKIKTTPKGNKLHV